MSSKAKLQFTELVEYVDQLIAIHGRIQKGKGRRHEQEALHRAGVVMMVAAWESYVERIVMEALDAIEHSAGIAALTASIAPVPSWAKHAFALRRAEIASLVKRFNTPDATKTRDLFASCLEFDVWPNWVWHVGPRQWDAKAMRGRLDSWVQIRHSVAHGFPLPTDIDWLKDSKKRPRLTLTLLRECKSFFKHVVALTDASLGTHLKSHHATPAPW